MSWPGLAGRAHHGWRRAGQDLPRPGAGPRPAGRQRRLRQAGGAAPGRRGPRPFDRAGRGTNALRPPDPLSTADLEQELGSSGLDAVLEKVAAAWQPVHDRSDVVVVEGLSPGSARLYASGLNQALAKAIDADVLLVASWPAGGVGTGEDLADRAAELKLGPLPRRAQRDRAGRPAPYRRDRAGPTGMGAHPGLVRHRPAHSCGRRRQLRDRDAGA